MSVKQSKMKQKTKRWIFQLLGTLGGSLLGNLLTGKGVMRAGEGAIQGGKKAIQAGEGVVRAGEGTIRTGQDF